MIIENFTLKRFGGHESIDFNSNSSIVGVFGPNGSGKSTILEGLKFVITGETADSQSVYVKDLKGSASASARFRKNGKLGQITRNIGTKASRSLVWDNKSTTAAKEVTALMSDIFGADKKAVANAVFVSQGMMQNMLFCGDASRRDSFVELLNLSFCAARADVLYRKIQKLQSTIVDLTPARDAALSQRDGAAQAYLDKKGLAEGLHDWEVEVEYLATMQKATNETQVFQSQLSQAITDRQIKESGLAGLLTQYNFDSVSAAEAALKQLNADYVKLDKDLTQKQSIRAQLSHYDRVSGDIAAIHKEMSGIRQRVAAADPDGAALAGWTNRLRLVEAEEKTATQRKQLTAELERQQRNLEQATIPVVLEPTCNAQGLVVLRKQVDDAILDWSTHNKSLQMQKEIASCMQAGVFDGTSKCPKCDLTITDANRLLPEELARMEEIDTELMATKVRLSGEYQENRATWEQYVRDQAIRNKLRDNAQKRIAELITELEVLPDVSGELAAAAKVKITEVINVLRVSEQEDQSARRRLSAKLVERSGYTLAIQHLTVRGDYGDEIIGELMVQKENMQQRMREVTTQFQSLHQFSREVNRLGNQQAALQVEIDKRAAQLNQEETAELSALRAEISDSNVLQQEINARRVKCLELRAQVAQLEESYAATNAALHVVEDRMKKDEQKRALITDLLKLRDLLGNDGLPLVYSRLQFEKLAELTQMNLVKLNASFAIELDQSRDLAFSFKRLDRDSGVLLPMSSLSGGQRVRLCVAFLIAVQKHLVPEVGLLVLDEPTTSVDEAGRTEIAEFLAGLGRDLQNTEMQVWVCDHSSEVKDRIDCKIELK